MGNSRTHLNFYRQDGIKSRLKKSGRSGWDDPPEPAVALRNPIRRSFQETSRSSVVRLISLRMRLGLHF